MDKIEVTNNTRTGDVLETMVLATLDHGKYRYQKHVNIGKRFGALGRHLVGFHMSI